MAGPVFRLRGGPLRPGSPFCGSHGADSEPILTKLTRALPILPDDRYDSPMSTKRAILEAATDLACELGPAGVTLSAVSDRAGVTKGALFHYFKTKEDLVRGLLEHVAGTFEEEVNRRTAEVPFAKALVDLTIETARDSSRLISAMLTAVMLDRNLAATVATRTDHWHRRLLAEGLSAEQARLLRTALDGLLFSVGTGTAPRTPGWLDELHHCLYALLRPSSREMLARVFQHALEQVDP